MRKIAFFAAAVLAATGIADARGTILTSGATIAAGEGEAPGRVVIDPSGRPGLAPTLPPLAPLPARAPFDATLHAFDAGVGGGFFSAGADTTLPGGTYDYTGYYVGRGVTVTYTGAVKIRTIENVAIDGRIVAQSGVEFDCGGDFRCDAHGDAQSGSISAGSGALVVDAVGSLTTGSTGLRSEIDAGAGVTMIARGAGVALAPSYADITCDAPGPGAVSFLSANGLSIDQTNVLALGADVLVAALAGDVNLHRTELRGAGVRVEASGAVTFDSAWAEASVVSDAPTVRVDAYGGAVSLRNSSSLGTWRDRGRAHVAAAAGIEIVWSADVEHAAEVLAYGGDVTIAHHAGTNTNGGAHACDIAASGSVVIDDSAGPIGDTSVRALGGDVTITDRASLSQGRCDLRASGTITVGEQSGIGGGGQTSLSAGAGVNIGGNVGGEGLSILASGPIVVRGWCDADSGYSLSLASLAGDVDLAGAKLTTRSQDASDGRDTSRVSGAIRVITFGGDSATIDATNATIQSGRAPYSGDVVLAVRRPAVATDLFVTVLGIAVSNANPARSIAAGQFFVDLGGASLADLAGDATLTIGGVPVALTLAAGTHGRLVSTTSGQRCVVALPFAGSRFASCAFLLRGDFRPAAIEAATGSLDVRIEAGPLDASGRIGLVKNRFALKRGRGSLVAPTIEDAAAAFGPRDAPTPWLRKLLRRAAR